MKTVLLAIAVLVLFVSCHSSSTETVVTSDSTQVVDSIKVVDTLKK